MTHRLDVTALIDRRPVTTYQWTIFALCALTMVVDGFDAQAIGYVAPALVKPLGLAPGSLGPIFTAGVFGMALGNLGFGLLSDRLGRRTVLILSLVLFGTLTLAKALARTGEEILVLQFLAGLGIGGAYPNALALAAEYAPAPRRNVIVTRHGHRLPGRHLARRVPRGAAAAGVRVAGRVRDRRHHPAGDRRRGRCRDAQLRPSARAAAGRPRQHRAHRGTAGPRCAERPRGVLHRAGGPARRLPGCEPVPGRPRHLHGADVDHGVHAADGDLFRVQLGADAVHPRRAAAAALGVRGDGLPAGLGHRVADPGAVPEAAAGAAGGVGHGGAVRLRAGGDGAQHGVLPVAAGRGVPGGARQRGAGCDARAERGGVPDADPLDRGGLGDGHRAARPRWRGRCWAGC